MLQKNTLSRGRTHRRSRYVNPTSVTLLLLVIGVISVASWRMSEAKWVESQFVEILGRPAMLVHRCCLVAIQLVANVTGQVTDAKTVAELETRVAELQMELETLRLAGPHAPSIEQLESGTIGTHPTPAQSQFSFQYRQTVLNYSIRILGFILC